MNAPATGPTAATLTYVYAVTPPAPVLDGLLPGLAGVAGSPVTLLTPPDGAVGAPVAFVVSDVPGADWAEDVLKRRFEDLRWLEDTARAHHHVIETLAAHTTVLPLRMATLYQDRVRALRALQRQGQEFATQLAELSAHTEYGVKVYVRPGGAAPAGGTDSAGAAPAPAGPGRSYLRARRAQQDAREDHYRQARLAADRIAELGRRCAARQVHHPPQSGPLAAQSAAGAEGGENVLNDAFLVSDSQADAFRAGVLGAVEDLPGIHVEVTGPWAPYSFAAAPAPEPDPATDPVTDPVGERAGDPAPGPPPAVPPVP
ncbi:GvpL/GvpF family gas vesicle protein [Streptomyces sp. NPDC012888]|uniref:GvpL/GvpF family gas vesicle protein n=1 Tax=Streptomyces sp. NPDC012888 TaxID=3364855 RepID=UPI0036A99B6E